jgi:hypothetical protein
MHHLVLMLMAVCVALYEQASDMRTLHNCDNLSSALDLLVAWRNVQQFHPFPLRLDMAAERAWTALLERFSFGMAIIRAIITSFTSLGYVPAAPSYHEICTMYSFSILSSFLLTPHGDSGVGILLLLICTHCPLSILSSKF